FSEKYKSQRYFAYFQSYTNTYKNINELEKIYLEALNYDKIEGMVVATRPDCVNDEIFEMISNIAKNKYVSIEFGAESTNDKTLKFINRGHTWQQTVDAVFLAKRYNLNCGLHFILGLPGETENDFYEHAKKISKLPVDTLKLHQLQVLKETKLHEIFISNPELFIDLSFENYKKIIIRFLENLNQNIIIDRLTSESPKDMLIYPNWNGMKNFEIVHIINNEMKKKNTWQGKEVK
ncbi:MAG: TIGR01212 family radical SAM protein, partial [Bacteroidales bacterium]|nr:TIGR01212 family radical SAM protein [Bacteroidales bacterium]